MYIYTYIHRVDAYKNDFIYTINDFEIILPLTKS